MSGSHCTAWQARVHVFFGVCGGPSSGICEVSLSAADWQSRRVNTQRPGVPRANGTDVGGGDNDIVLVISFFVIIIIAIKDIGERAVE